MLCRSCVASPPRPRPTDHRGSPQRPALPFGAMRSGVVPWSGLFLMLVVAACTSVDAAAPPPASIPPVHVAGWGTTTSIEVAIPQAAGVAAPVTTAATVESTATVTATGTATAEPPPPLHLLFTGDVLMHSPLWAQAVRNGAGTPDFTPMFEGIRPLVQDADLAVCHLETPVAPAGEAWTTHPRYGVPGEVVDALAATGFDHC
jgi:hypothetical protein